jgi:hypothetical protein
VRQLRAVDCSTPNPSTGQAGPVLREVGGYTYYYIPDAADNHGKHWNRIRNASLLPLPPTINGFTAATPEQMLTEVKEATTVSVAGPASGPGWTGTRYTYRETLKNQTTLSGTVTVDRQGRTRALVLTIRTTGAGKVSVITQDLTFSDFGAPVTVTPPPPDQTYTQR